MNIKQPIKMTPSLVLDKNQENIPVNNNNQSSLE